MRAAAMSLPFRVLRDASRVCLCVPWLHTARRRSPRGALLFFLFLWAGWTDERDFLLAQGWSQSIARWTRSERKGHANGPLAAAFHYGPLSMRSRTPHRRSCMHADARGPAAQEREATHRQRRAGLALSPFAAHPRPNRKNKRVCKGTQNTAAPMGRGGSADTTVKIRGRRHAHVAGSFGVWGQARRPYPEGDVLDGVDCGPQPKCRHGGVGIVGDACEGAERGVHRRGG